MRDCRYTHVTDTQWITWPGRHLFNLSKLLFWDWYLTSSQACSSKDIANSVAAESIVACPLARTEKLLAGDQMPSWHIICHIMFLRVQESEVQMSGAHCQQELWWIYDTTGSRPNTIHLEVHSRGRSIKALCQRLSQMCLREQKENGMCNSKSYTFSCLKKREGKNTTQP